MQEGRITWRTSVFNSQILEKGSTSHISSGLEQSISHFTFSSIKKYAFASGENCPTPNWPNCEEINFYYEKKTPQYSKVNTCLTLNKFENSVVHVCERAGIHQLIFILFSCNFAQAMQHTCHCHNLKNNVYWITNLKVASKQLHHLQF